MGIGSVLSFNAWASWHPFSAITRLRSMTFFDALDFISANLLLRYVCPVAIASVLLAAFA